MIKFVKHTPLCLIQPLNYKFAAAAAAAVDYYSLLGVQRGSTTREIQEAFSKLTRNVTPDSNSALFNRITEAFVILSDGKARDAYDSLLKVRKFSYINQPPTTKPVVTSYLADRKAQKQKQFASKYNIDKFGRYRGGVPRPNTTVRGRAINDIGTLFRQQDRYSADPYPEYTFVDTEKAESFKNFHQNERQHRTAKKTWYTPTIDYEFFTVRRFLDKLTFVKYAIFFTFLAPTLTVCVLGLKKRIAKGLADYEKKIKEGKKEGKKAAH